MMSRIAVVAFNRMSCTLSNYMPLCWQNFGKCDPIICKKYAIFQVLHFIIESPECCAITTTENPGDSSPATAVKGFDEPKFSFFDWMKGHILSNSISAHDCVRTSSPACCKTLCLMSKTERTAPHPVAVGTDARHSMVMLPCLPSSRNICRSSVAPVRLG